jgi:hypothetical protein
LFLSLDSVGESSYKNGAAGSGIPTTPHAMSESQSHTTLPQDTEPNDSVNSSGSPHGFTSQINVPINRNVMHQISRLDLRIEPSRHRHGYFDLKVEAIVDGETKVVSSIFQADDFGSTFDFMMYNAECEIKKLVARSTKTQ